MKYSYCDWSKELSESAMLEIRYDISSLGGILYGLSKSSLNNNDHKIEGQFLSSASELHTVYTNELVRFYYFDSNY